MKKILLLLSIVMCCSFGVNAAFTQVSLQIIDEGGLQSQELPESGMPLVDLSEGGTNAESVFKVDGFRALTTGTVQGVKICASIYPVDTEPEVWHEVDGQNIGSDEWGVSGLDINLLKDLNQGTSYILEVYFEGIDGSGNKFYYNNGGENYKVCFMPGKEQSEVSFYDQETAGLTMYVDARMVNFVLNGDGTKTPDGHLGNISSLILDEYWVRCLRESGVELEDVSLQWRLCDPDGEVLNGWNRVDYQYQMDEDGDKHKKYFYASNLVIDLLNTCSPGNDYVLEIMYQLINSKNGKYYFFGKNEEVGRFYFSFGHNPVEILGDFDNSGLVDVEDVNAAINIILKVKTQSDYPGNGDMDDNGMIDVEDVNALINIILKID
ncbi:MAG: hypothetical protein J6S96_01945 [Muribaculaceae bacterium]|nr:hypothetical protein [Muribaculaceae bacterium]